MSLRPTDGISSQMPNTHLTQSMRVRPAAATAQPSLLQVTEMAQTALHQLVTAAERGWLFASDCARLTKQCSELAPVLEDLLEPGHASLAADGTVIDAVLELEAALSRCAVAVDSCSTIGPVYAATHDAAVASEFASCAVDVHAALEQLVRAAAAGSLLCPSSTSQLTATLQQLHSFAAAFSPDAALLLAELRCLAEKVRLKQTSVAAFRSRAVGLLQLTRCSRAQLGADVRYLRRSAATLASERRHVEAAFFTELLQLTDEAMTTKRSRVKQDSASLDGWVGAEGPLGPSAGAAAPNAGGDYGGNDLLSRPLMPSSSAAPAAQLAAAAAAAAVAAAQAATTAMLDVALASTTPMQQRLAALQALSEAVRPLPRLAAVAAAAAPAAVSAAAPPGGGAPLADAAATSAALPGWHVVSLLQQPHVVAALLLRIATGLQDAPVLLRLLVLAAQRDGDVSEVLIGAGGLDVTAAALARAAADDSELKLPALQLLRQLAALASPAQRSALLRARLLLPTLVRTIGTVKFKYGSAQAVAAPSRSSLAPHGRTAADGKSSSAAAAGPPPSMSPRKASAATSRGLRGIGDAAPARDQQPSPLMGVPAAEAAANAISSCCEQDVMEQACLLVSLLAEHHTAEVSSAGCGTVAVLAQALQAHPQHSRTQRAAATALALLAQDARSALEAVKHSALPSLAHMVLHPDSDSHAAASAALLPLLAGSAVLGGTGRTMVITTTQAILDIMLSGGAAACSASQASLLLPALGALLHCAASPDGRTCIHHHSPGMAALLGSVALADTTAAASAVLARIGWDSDLKPYVGRRLAQAMLASRSDPGACARLAAAVADAAQTMPPSANEGAAASAAAAFCAEVVECDVVPTLVELLRNSDLCVRTAGACAMQALAAHSRPAVAASLCSSGAVAHLVDCCRLGGPQPPGAALGAAAASALHHLVMRGGADARGAVYGPLVESLRSADVALASAACFAVAVIAGEASEALALLSHLGAPLALVSLLLRCPDTRTQVQAVRLLCTLVRVDQGSVDGVVAGGAVATLLRCMRPATGGGADGDVSVACAVGVHLLARQSEMARSQVQAQGGTALLLVLMRNSAAAAASAPPVWADALAALACLMLLQPAARREAAAPLRGALIRGLPHEATAAALVCSSLASRPGGRELLFEEGLIEPLVKLLSAPSSTLGGNASAAATLAAMDALTHAALPAWIHVMPGLHLERGAAAVAAAAAAAAADDNGDAEEELVKVKVSPKALLVRAGVVPPLVALLSITMAAGGDEQCVREAAHVLERLAGSDEAVRAMRAARAPDALQALVLRGKRREVSDKTAAAAYDALLRIL